jgi:hypothetical protein
MAAVCAVCLEDICSGCGACPCCAGCAQWCEGEVPDDAVLTPPPPWAARYLAALDGA